MPPDQPLVVQSLTFHANKWSNLAIDVTNLESISITYHGESLTLDVTDLMRLLKTLAPAPPSKPEF